jgi:hypothetical protein
VKVWLRINRNDTSDWNLEDEAGREVTPETGTMSENEGDYALIGPFEVTVDE